MQGNSTGVLSRAWEAGGMWLRLSQQGMPINTHVQFKYNILRASEGASSEWSPGHRTGSWVGEGRTEQWWWQRVAQSSPSPYQLG